MSNDFYCDEALSGSTPVTVVFETDDVLAFHHTRPYWPIHIVVIPKRHVPSLTDLGDADESLLHNVLTVGRHVAQRVAAYLAGIAGTTAALNVSGRGVKSDEGAE